MISKPCIIRTAAEAKLTWDELLFRHITWMYKDTSPTHLCWSFTLMVNDRWGDSFSYVNLNFFMIIVNVELKFTSVPCFQLSLHLKSVQTQKPLFFCHRRLWCNIILQAPWMERVALTTFICKSLRGSVLLTYKSRRHQRFALWFVAGKHQICTNGKKKGEKKHYWQHPHLIWALIKSKPRLRFKSLANATAEYVEKNHTQAQTFTINRAIKYALDKSSISINMESFLYQSKTIIRLCPPPENVWTVGKDILISPWYTGVLSCLVAGNWRQFMSRLRVLSKWKWTCFHNNQNVDTIAMIKTNMGTR